MATAIPDVPLSTSWREKLANKFYGLKIADAALQVAKDSRRQAVAEHAIRSAYSVAGGGQPLPLAGGEDDMGVRVGDELHYHYQQPTAASAASAGGSVASTLGRLATGAALLMGGACVGVPAGMAMLKYLGDQPTAGQSPAVAQPLPEAPPFIDNQYDFGIETE